MEIIVDSYFDYYKCSSDECLGLLFATCPMLNSLAYSLWATIGFNFGRPPEDTPETKG
jgi:hypothetical protein